MRRNPLSRKDVPTVNSQCDMLPAAVRIQRGDSVRAKLAELDLTEADIGDAVTWARPAVDTKVSAKAGPRSRAKVPRRA